MVYMLNRYRAIFILVTFLALPIRSVAAPVAYIDESRFLADLAAMGYEVTHEGFEDDVVWGDFRSGVPDGFHTVNEVTNQGMIWTSNFQGGEIITGTGPARSGSYGFYAIPHGSYATPDPGADCFIPGECGDGWRGRASRGLIYAIGGWVETNTPFAKIGLYISEYPDNSVDFGETCDPPESENCYGNATIGTAHSFFGVIDTQGFDRFEFRELEGKLELDGGDIKYIFADDFYFVVRDELLSVGGNVSGLEGTGLVLQNNAEDDLAISANGGFTFSAELADDSTYTVTVLAQPTSPNQTCTVSNGSGKLAGADVTNVAVFCTTTAQEILARDLIDSFYVNILGRGPEPGAVDSWYNGYFQYAVSFDIDVRFVPREMARIFFLSEEYANRNHTDEEFIRDCYQVFLDRQPSSGELAGWLSGVWDRPAVMTLFAESQEFGDRIQALFPGLSGDPTRNFVTTMYIGLLDRLADSGGLEYFAGLFDEAYASGGIEGVRAEAHSFGRTVLSSDEYLSMAPTNETHVIRLYRAYLGRFPAMNEIDYWSGELTAGRETTDTLIDEFAASAEFTDRLNTFF